MGLQNAANSEAQFVRQTLLARHEIGYGDRALGQRVDSNTIFHWGSITKTLTAIAVMQLVERRRLSLDARVTDYIPELRRVHSGWGTTEGEVPPQD